MIIDMICYALSGFFMKVSDEYMDLNNNEILAIITGLLCVLFTIIVSTRNGDAACIFLSILIGTFFAQKIDSVNHILSAVLLIILLFILGVPNFSIICLIFCIIAAYIDERGNDISDEIEKRNLSSEKGFLYKFFKYRYTLKVTVFVFSLIGLINIFFTNNYLSLISFAPITIINFYLFDLSYEYANLLFKRFYNTF